MSSIIFWKDWSNTTNGGGMIDRSTKNKRMKLRDPSEWNDKNKIHLAFDELFRKYQKSILVVSYRSDGIPVTDELCALMRKYKTSVKVSDRKSYQYVLSKKKGEEVLIVGY